MRRRRPVVAREATGASRAFALARLRIPTLLAAVAVLLSVGAGGASGAIVMGPSPAGACRSDASPFPPHLGPPLCPPAEGLPATPGRQAPAVRTATVPCAEIPLIDDRCESWVGVYDNPNGQQSYGTDWALSVAASPDGDAVYVTGLSFDDATGARDIATVAYDAPSGTELWASRYGGPSGREDWANVVEVSPDGATLYVGGTTDAPTARTEPGDYVVLAYDARTGEELWVSTYDGAQSYDDVWALAVAPGGDTVYATGFSYGEDGYPDVATVAFASQTGERVWADRWGDDSVGPDGAWSLAVSPDGATVVAAGWGALPEDRLRPEYYDYAVIAYEAADEEHLGERRWVRTYGTPASDEATSVAISPDGERAYVTGRVHAFNTRLATLALSVATGEVIWEQVRMASGNDGWVEGSELVVSPDGGRLYVVGAESDPSDPAGVSSDPLVMAYRAADGTVDWARTYGRPDQVIEVATQIGISDDGGLLYTAGFSNDSGDVATVAVQSYDGEPIWTARFKANPLWDTSWPTGLVVTEGGVFVSVMSFGDPACTLAPPNCNYGDYHTLGYVDG